MGPGSGDPESRVASNGLFAGSLPFQCGEHMIYFSNCAFVRQVPSGVDMSTLANRPNTAVLVIDVQMGRGEWV